MKANSPKKKPAQISIKIEDLPNNYQQVAHTIGLEKALALSRHMGGGAVYVPHISKLLRVVTSRAVRKEFNGKNCIALGIKYGYTERWIREMLKEKC